MNRITQNRDTIVIQYGQMGLRRTIYMNMKTHPANVKPSRAGHSIGRWEGDTLVVDTVGFLPGVLNAPVRHSDKLHVVERFTLDPATMQLTRTYEAEGPGLPEGHLHRSGHHSAGRRAVRAGQLQGTAVHQLLEAGPALTRWLPAIMHSRSMRSTSVRSRRVSARARTRS